MLVTGTLRDADIVELVPLVSSEEYGERAGELLARIPFDEAIELVVPEVLGMILRVNYWDCGTWRAFCTVSATTTPCGTSSR